MTLPLVVDLYCGLGGWSDGFLAEGYRCIGFDIERHDYGTGGYPGQFVLQDVLTLHGSQFRNAACIVASPPCFVAETLILTARGMIPIPEVVPGDLVLTHRKRWRRVLRTGSTFSPTVVAKGYGGCIEGTAEHPIYARRNEGSVVFWNKQSKRPDYKPKTLGQSEWLGLGSMEGSHWGTPTEIEPLPIPDLPNGIPNVPEFWWMVGRWVGDGWVRFRNRKRTGDEVLICCGKSEADDLAIRLGAFSPESKRAKRGELRWRRSEERTTVRFTAASNSLAAWLVEHFGRGAKNKSWPAWVFGMDPSLRRALLDGYVSADGSEGVNSGTRIIRTATISKRLAIGTRMLSASLGYAASLFFTRRPKTCEIEGRTTRQEDTWNTNWTPGSGSNRLVERSEGILWGLVRKVSPGRQVAQVWNLEVDEDNSYVAEGFIVHNCQEFSYMAMPWSRAKQIAKALRGQGEFPEGYTGSRTIAQLTALFDACFRIQREACEAAGRYIPMVVENVRGAEAWVGKAKANFGSFYLWGDVGMIGSRVVCGLEFGKGVRPVRATKTVGHANMRDGHTHTRHLTNQAESDALRGDGHKVPGLDFHEYEKTGKPGRSFQSAAVDGVKLCANTRGLPNFQQGDPRRVSGAGINRKAASAAIAKIPFELARYVARAYRPSGRRQASQPAINACSTPATRLSDLHAEQERIELV